MAEENAVETVETPEPTEVEVAAAAAEHTQQVETTVDDIASSLRLSEEPEPKAEVVDEPKTEPAAAAVVEPKPAVAAAVVDDSPNTWRPEAKAKWAATPPEVKAEIAKRELDVARFTSEMGETANVGKGFQKMLAPYADLFKQNNINPWNHVGGLLQGHHQIMFGPKETRVAILRNLARDAQIDLRELAGTPADPNAPAPTAIDPRVQSEFETLRRENAQLRENVTGVSKTLYDARTAELTSAVTAFIEDKVAHPYFDEVATDIPALIDSKAARTLQEAYDLAVLRNPVTRQKQVAAESKRLSEAAEKQRLDKLKLVKTATGANVRSRGAGRSATPDESIDDTLNETMASIKSR